MDSLNRILIPIDFSLCARHALEVGVWLARQVSASAVALHVYEPSPSPFGRPTSAPPELEGKLATFVRPDLERAGARRVDTLVHVGDPAADVVARAASLPADLIVMGAHGGTGYMPGHVGAVSAQVIRETACPVLLVREPHHRRGSARPPIEEEIGLPLRAVLIVGEASEGAADAIAAALATRLGAEIERVARPSGTDRQEKTIVAHAGELDVDLIVVGLGASERGLGVALARHARCPVLIVPEPSRD